MRNDISEKHKSFVEEVLKNVLSSINNKDYGMIGNYVDESEWEDFDIIEEILELQGIETVDGFGAKYNFESSYECSQISYYQYEDLSGFAVDYDLTEDGESIDITLQLEFIYSGDRLVSRFLCIDA